MSVKRSGIKIFWERGYLRNYVTADENILPFESFKLFRDIEKIEYDTERDYYMSAKEALEYNIVDEILTKKALH